VDSVIIYPDRVHVLFNFSEKKYLPQQPPQENGDSTVNIDHPNAFPNGKVVRVYGGEGSSSLSTTQPLYRE